MNSTVTVCDSCLFLGSGLLSRQLAEQLPSWHTEKTISWTALVTGPQVHQPQTAPEANRSHGNQEEKGNPSSRHYLRTSTSPEAPSPLCQAPSPMHSDALWKINSGRGREWTLPSGLFRSWIIALSQIAYWMLLFFSAHQWVGIWEQAEQYELNSVFIA